MIPKPLFAKTLLSFSFSSSQFRHSPLLYHLSTGVRSHSSSTSESKNVRVSVWWDFQTCNLPIGADAFKVATRIRAALRTNGINGPLQITAFGDMWRLSRPNKSALSDTGIILTHIPKGRKKNADMSQLVVLLSWVSQNPPPAHLFLISGERHFSGILHRLRMNNYNILLSSTDSAPSELCSAASIMWNWNSLVRGEDLNGRHFNLPPDGLYDSWYGHAKVTLEDPFSNIEQPTSSQGEELSEQATEQSPTSLNKSTKLNVEQ